MAMTVTTDEQLSICDLTPNRVSLKISKVTAIGDKAYTDDPDWFMRSNSETGRAEVQERLETDYPSYCAAIMAMWGDEPTVFSEAKPTTEQTDTATE